MVAILARAKRSEQPKVRNKYTYLHPRREKHHYRRQTACRLPHHGEVTLRRNQTRGAMTCVDVWGKKLGGGGCGLITPGISIHELWFGLSGRPSALMLSSRSFMNSQALTLRFVFRRSKSRAPGQTKSQHLQNWAQKEG